MISVSPVTKAQWVKVVKAVVYSFVSAAIAAFAVNGSDLSKKALFAVVVAGVNGALVTIKALFTEG